MRVTKWRGVQKRRREGERRDKRTGIEEEGEERAEYDVARLCNGLTRPGPRFLSTYPEVVAHVPFSPYRALCAGLEK